MVKVAFPGECTDMAELAEMVGAETELLAVRDCVLEFPVTVTVPKERLAEDDRRGRIQMMIAATAR